jgi:hypothetical protein
MPRRESCIDSRECGAANTTSKVDASWSVRSNWPAASMFASALQQSELLAVPDVHSVDGPSLFYGLVH